MLKLTIYMKSGNVIVLDRISDYKWDRLPDGSINNFQWTTDKLEKGQLKHICLDQVEAIYAEKK